MRVIKSMSGLDAKTAQILQVLPSRGERETSDSRQGWNTLKASTISPVGTDKWMVQDGTHHLDVSTTYLYLPDSLFSSIPR